ncbi:MAG: FG-GAP-like repeat-containing protein, partial [Thermoplasmatales archaeon]|nr:FG-GAP-like repeat-containing protein [Thermoplasmatales archaeon]
KPLDPDYVEGGPLDEPAFYDIATPNPKYYMYEYNCTAPSTAGQYLVDATMKDTAGNLFMTWDTIYICNPDGSVPNYPKIVTCKDANNDGDLSDLYEETEFKHTEKMYVKVVTKDTNAIENVDMGDVEINDFKGIWHIKKNIMPDATTGNPPVSGVNTTTAPSSLGWDGRAQGSEFYTFSIDLLNPNHAGWLKGTNTYILMVRYFKDGNEEYGKLAMLVKVKGPVSSMDIIVTTEETSYAAWKSDGSAQWFDNGNYWERTFIDPAAMKNAEAMVIGDVDGDGDNDVVVGFREDEPNNIMWYRNTAPDGKEWQRHAVSTTIGGSDYKVLSLALGDLDNDGDMEIIAGLEKAGQNIPGIVFVNDGDWTPVQLPGAGGGVSGAAKPLTQGSSDNTSEPNTTDAKTNDQNYYTVSTNKMLHFNSWDITGISGTITGVTLNLQYKTDSDYTGDSYIQFNNSASWQNAILISKNTSETNVSYNLYAQGVNTYTEIENLGIRFLNNGNKTTVNATLIPTMKGDEDNTGGSAVDIQTDNDAYYIIKNAVLHLKNFANSSILENETIYNVTLELQYKTESGYQKDYPIQYRKGPSDTWNNTTINITNKPSDFTVQDSNFKSFTTKADID